MRKAQFVALIPIIALVFAACGAESQQATAPPTPATALTAVAPVDSAVPSVAVAPSPAPTAASSPAPTVAATPEPERVAEIDAQLPAPQLLQRIDLAAFAEPNTFFRTNAQFGDLNNDGVYGDFIRYVNSRVMQAFAWNGENVALLWEYESPVSQPDAPEKYHYKYTIWDIDADGASEIIGPFASAEGFIELRILDGATGTVERSFLTKIQNPKSDDDVSETRIDAVVANVRGLEQPQDIILNSEYDSYGEMWVFDHELNLLWDTTADRKQRIYTHFPHTADIDGDGKDELVGARVFDDGGAELWQSTPDSWRTKDHYFDHTDRVFVGDLDPARDGMEVLVSYEGTRAKLFDSAGEMLWEQRGGNKDAKLTAVGEFNPDLDGVEMLYWDPSNNENTHILNSAGAEVFVMPGQIEDGYAMDWDGDRSRDELFAARDGQVIIPFSELSFKLADNYATDAQTPMAEGMRLYAHALDITGDSREEIVVLDEDELLIYGAEGAAADAPSPWDDPAYRLAVANTQNDNHPERRWLDWRVISKLTADS
jgi:hypothetical protein